MYNVNSEAFIRFNRSDIAWKDAKYAQIWEYLRDEFELTQRFASLDFKLKFVEVVSPSVVLFISFFAMRG